MVSLLAYPPFIRKAKYKNAFTLDNWYGFTWHTKSSYHSYRVSNKSILKRNQDDEIMQYKNVFIVCINLLMEFNHHFHAFFKCFLKGEIIGAHVAIDKKKDGKEMLTRSDL